MSKDWTGNKKSVWATLGASNHTDKERQEHDYYATDPVVLEKLTRVFPIRHKVYEPACGEGHLSKWLIEQGHDVLSTDLIDRGYGHGGVDFLKVGSGTLFNGNGDQLFTKWGGQGNEPFDILTNPPYKISTQFILHALELVPENGRVIMFLKTAYLEGINRKKLIYDVNPPRWVFQFSGRVVCAKSGDFESMKKIGSAQAYCFMVWNKENKELKTEIKWLP